MPIGLGDGIGLSLTDVFDGPADEFLNLNAASSSSQSIVAVVTVEGPVGGSCVFVVVRTFCSARRPIFGLLRTFWHFSGLTGEDGMTNGDSGGVDDS